MQLPPILPLGTRHVTIHKFGKKHYLQFRDGPHLIDSFQVTEEGLREGTWDEYVVQWNEGKIPWNRLSNMAKQLRSELSA